MKKTIRTLAYLMPVVALLVFPLLTILPAQAGIYDADSEIVYKEFWVPHSTDIFTGGIKFDEGSGKCKVDNYGSWYLEAWAPCDKETTFDFPHDLSAATKVEIYFDLWRNHKGRAMTFQLNDGPWHTSERGDEWSRTPWVMEIPKSELIHGTNTLTLRDRGAGAYHVHDIAFRIYEPGIAAPTGSLLTVKGDGSALNAASGGVLMVDNDTLTLSAQTAATASFVEFHGYYDGFDEDTDGATRDWHSRGRNNCYPGGGQYGGGGYYCAAGNPGAGQHGTIDHVGTDDTADGGNNYSVTWNLKHVPNQSGVKFKIRIAKLDPSNSTTLFVRETAGGVSAPFTLKRTRAVQAYVDPDFEDTVLRHTEALPAPYWADRLLDIPADPADFSKTYLLGSFWNNPMLQINPEHESGTDECPPRAEPHQTLAFGGDHWKTSIREISPSWWQAGENKIRYANTNCGLFEFVERPGPMVVAHFSGSMVDGAPPTISNQSPTSGQTAVRVFSNIVITLSDPIQGVDFESMVLKVGGVTVTPFVSGFPQAYTLTYDPPTNFPNDTTIGVELDACDLGGNCMPKHSFSFETESSDTTIPGPSNIVSDDFNVCALDTNVWTFDNPLGDSSFQVVGDRLEIQTAGGSSHDVWSSVDAPNVTQTISNTNFTLTAKFDSSAIFDAPDQGLHKMRGILVQQDEDNFLRLSLDHNGKDPGVTITKKVDGVPDLVIIGPDDVTFGQTPQYMRVRRVGSSWFLDISPDGVDWTVKSNFYSNLTATSIGLFAGNADTSNNPVNAPAHTAVIDYLFNMDSPIIPEDGKALYLKDVVADPPAGGVVSAEPVTPTLDAPGCGNPVRLTATPSAGYEFANWTSDLGSVSGDQPIMETGFTFDETITGRFEPVAYSLEVNVVNNGEGTGGSVDWSPALEVYAPNEQVALTATVPVGWTFDGWDGDLSGTELNKTLSITGSMAVTATFQLNQYALTTDTIGQGSVDATPAGPYVHGQSVTLAVTPEAGWAFKEWQGDVPAGSTDAPLTIDMDADKAITAVFEEAYSLDVQIEGNGKVAKDPDQAAYVKGSQVTLVAVPEAGWFFKEWQGDAPAGSTDATLVIAMDAEKMLKAIFEQTPPNEYSLTVSVSPVGQGDISKSPDLITYPDQTAVTLTATPQTGWIFREWGGDAPVNSANTELTITMDSDKTITAVFIEAGDYIIYLPSVQKRPE